MALMKVSLLSEPGSAAYRDLILVVLGVVKEDDAEHIPSHEVCGEQSGREDLLRVSECVQVADEVPSPDNTPCEQGPRAEEAAHATERATAALERRVLDQDNECSSSLATRRVNLDGMS